MQDAIVFSTVCIFRTFTLPTVNKMQDAIRLQIKPIPFCLCHKSTLVRCLRNPTKSLLVATDPVYTQYYTRVSPIRHEPLLYSQVTSPLPYYSAEP
jgi:hypothetical protein